jgi:hypothetical protein
MGNLVKAKMKDAEIWTEAGDITAEMEAGTGKNGKPGGKSLS